MSHNLLVTGGNQGGQRSIITAALDRRVTGLAATYPAYCEVTGDLHGQAGSRPHMFRIDRCANREDEAATEWRLTAFKLKQVRTNTEPDRWKPTS